MILVALLSLAVFSSPWWIPYASTIILGCPHCKKRRPYNHRENFNCNDCRFLPGPAESCFCMILIKNSGRKDWEEEYLCANCIRDLRQKGHVVSRQRGYSPLYSTDCERSFYDSHGPVCDHRPSMMMVDDNGDLSCPECGDKIR